MAKPYFTRRRRISLKKAKSKFDLAFFLAGAVGIEPTAYGFGDRRSTS